MRSEVLGELHGEHAEAAGRSVDQYALSRRDCSLPKKVQGARGAHEHRTGFLERHRYRFVREEAAFGDAGELCVRAELVAARPEDVIARVNLVTRGPTDSTVPARSVPRTRTLVS